jgi:protein TonB
MRTCTILFSIAAHTLAILAVIAITLVATDVRPDPRRASEIVIVKPELPKPPPAPPRADRRDSQVATVIPAPIEAPAGMRPEPAFDAPPEAGVPMDGLVIGDPTAIENIAEPSPPPRLPRPAERIPVHVGGVISQPRRTHYVAPAYPPLAQAARIKGIVILEAMIGEDGAVREVRVLRSAPLLDQAAIDAVWQWRYTPTLLDGQPVPIVMTVTVGFDLH